MNVRVTQSTTPECDRYRANLDIFLDALPDNACRRRFLDKEFDRWTRLFERWLGDPDILPRATAFDFSITLADIATRQVKYGPMP